MYDAMLAETVTIRGDGGDEIEAYLARPMSPGPHGGVVVIHHMEYPTTEQVDELDQELKAQGKTYEFHTYEGAGHAFFSVNRPAYRPEAAVDGWNRIFTWFGRYLS
jgi:dienelactone hydrolase